MLDLMRELGVTSAGLAKVDEANRLSNALVPPKVDEANRPSNALVPLEEAVAAVKGRFKDSQGAFTVTREPDKGYALGLVFGKAYESQVKKIMAPLDAFVRMLGVRTSQSVAEVMQQVWLNQIVVFCCLGFVFCTIEQIILETLHISKRPFWQKAEFFYNSRRVAARRMMCAVKAFQVQSALGFSAWYVHRRVSVPLDETAAFADKVSNGQLGASLAVLSHDEIGKLRISLNNMVMHIRERIEEVEQALAQTKIKEREAFAARSTAEQALTRADTAARQMRHVAERLGEVVTVVSDASGLFPARFFSTFSLRRLFRLF